MRNRRTGTTRRPAILLATIVAAVLSALALSACGGSSGSGSGGNASGTTSAVVATAIRDVDVYPSADAASPIHTLPATHPTGTQQALLVTGSNGSRLEVLLPERPNGAHGWVSSDQVALSRTDLSVDISLTDRRLRVARNGAVFMDVPVAVGAPDTPTPTGLFYITDLLAPTNPDGAYGPFAFGLSGYSDVFTTFAGGDGQVGLHGTNAPESIGNAVTHGCLRVDNGVIRTLATTLGLGTPLYVHT